MLASHWSGVAAIDEDPQDTRRVGDLEALWRQPHLGFVSLPCQLREERSAPTELLDRAILTKQSGGCLVSPLTGIRNLGGTTPFAIDQSVGTNARLRRELWHHSLAIV